MDIPLGDSTVCQISDLIVQIIDCIDDRRLAPICVLKVLVNLAYIAHIRSFRYIGNGDRTDRLASLIDDIHRDFVVCTYAVFSRLDVRICIACCDSSVQLRYIDSIGTCSHILNSAVTGKSILIDSHISVREADLAAACATDGLHARQIFLHEKTCFIDCQIFLSIFELHMDLLIGDGDAFPCAQRSVCNLTLHIGYIGDRVLITSIYTRDICLCRSHTFQSCQVFA